MQISSEYNEEKERLSIRYSRLLEKAKSLENSNNSTDYLKVIKEIVSFERPNKTLLAKLIDRIEITDEREIIIHYTFNNPFK